MKKYLPLLLVFFAATFGGCEEEKAEWPLLIFSTEKITHSENVKLDYYSPDPSCVAKSYWIQANAGKSELVVKCTNASPIVLGYIPEPDKGFFTDPVEGGRDEKTYTSISGHWTATLIDDNTIQFTFDEMDEANGDECYFPDYGLVVSAKTSKGVLKTNFSVIRMTKAENTFDR